MFSLLKKELRSFFSSLTGYIVIIVFVAANSLFMWVFPGQFNVLDSGYATMDSLFYFAPWIFLFLAPAVTMRLFSEEKRTGTIELLLTRPLSDFHIVTAKYISGVLLVLFSLLPTLVYFVSVFMLGENVGNIDIGGTIGSYIGLFFLAAIYVAIGLFCSVTTENQIVSFVMAIALSFFFYIGFEAISSASGFRIVEITILELGINEHYKSMSRGVIDTRDIIYFVGVIGLFLFSTKTVLESRKW